MNIIKPYTVIQQPCNGIAMLSDIEAIARVSHMSQDRQTEDSWKKFILSVVIQHGDWSVVEHKSVTVMAVVDRGIQQEWTRHRLGAYTVESTRFVNYGKKQSINVIEPIGLNELVRNNWLIGVENAERAYLTMLACGESPQIARSVLPLCTASTMYITYNLRMWRHFFLLRTTKETHPQMLQVTLPLLQEFKGNIPILYDDIIPGVRQVDNLNKAR